MQRIATHASGGVDGVVKQRRMRQTSLLCCQGGGGGLSGGLPSQRGAPEYPPTQEQSDRASLPAGASALAGQEMQASDPVTDLYLPATHCAQGPPSGPEAPALQMQSDTASLPAGATALAGQEMQASDPVTDLYLPAAHFEQGPPAMAASMQPETLSPPSQLVSSP